MDQIDRSIFLALNGAHTWWLDGPMWYISRPETWIPLYVFMLWMLYKKYPGKLYFLVIGAVLLCLLFTDYMAATFVKQTVQRLRPGHNPELEGLVHHLIGKNGELYKGGKFSFFSNHASNYFGVATLFILLMKPLKRWAIIALLLWASLIAYSRIYLGVHYPGDILVGAVYGMTFAWIVSRLFYFIQNKFSLAR